MFAHALSKPKHFSEGVDLAGIYRKIVTCVVPSSISHAQRASVSGAGHMVVGDDNASFVGAIAPFLLSLG